MSVRALHLDERAAQDGGHVKHVGDAVALEHVGEAFRPVILRLCPSIADSQFSGVIIRVSG
jgi:hypothetical protein